MSESHIKPPPRADGPTDPDAHRRRDTQPPEPPARMRIEDRPEPEPEPEPPTLCRPTGRYHRFAGPHGECVDCGRPPTPDGD